MREGGVITRSQMSRNFSWSLKLAVFRRKIGVTRRISDDLRFGI